MIFLKKQHRDNEKIRKETVRGTESQQMHKGVWDANITVGWICLQDGCEQTALKKL